MQMKQHLSVIICKFFFFNQFINGKHVYITMNMDKEKDPVLKNMITDTFKRSEWPSINDSLECYSVNVQIVIESRIIQW